MHINGMETGLNALLILLFVSLYSNIRTTSGSFKDFARLGIVGGFLVLSRIDGAVLVLIVSLLELRAPNGFRNGMIVGCTALIVSSP
jgi:hypothetical protein